MAQTVHGFVFEDMEGGAPSRTYSKCKLESKEHISALSVGHDKKWSRHKHDATSSPGEARPFVYRRCHKWGRI